MKKFCFFLLLLVLAGGVYYFSKKSPSPQAALKKDSDEPLFYETLDNAPAPVLSPEEALQAFSIAPGFEIELVAAEPLIEDPVAMAWDEYGRLYVVELRGYMPDAYGNGSDEPVGQVVRLQDTNGDGRMDTSEVFLGALVNPRAVAVVNEGVLIGEPPNLWLCKLPTPTSVCTDKRKIGGYATDVTSANVEHMENGLLQGLDNWFYNSKSNRSLRIDDGTLQEREGLFRGQWGITKDDFGRLLYNHNSTWIQADFFAGEDLVLPGHGGRHKGLGVNLTAPAKVHSVRVNPGVNRAYLPNTLREDGRLNNATGVSGLVSYRGDQFPDRYRGDVFVPEVAGNVVAQFDMSEEGMALVAEQRLYEDPTWGQRDFLGSIDERFRPVDAMNGPDGALYIIDMYRGIVQDTHFLTDELRAQIFERELEAPLGMGRIWRVRHTEGKPSREVPNLAAASNEQLIAALESANGWVRDTAQRLLLIRGGDQTEPLAAIATGDNSLAALHAIWALQGRGELRRELVVKIATSGDVQRQIQVLRAGRTLLLADDFVALQQALQEAPEALTLQLAFAMGDCAEDASVRNALLNILSQNPDSPFVRQAVVRAVHGQEILLLQQYFSDSRFSTATPGGRALLTMLTGQAYASLRGDLRSPGEANVALLELLALIESRQAKVKWQQVAALKGLARVATSKDFVAVQLKEPPRIFTDTSIGEQDPLWKARLAGRAAFTWPGDEIALGIAPLSPEQMRVAALGEIFYPQCGACHGAEGAGIAGLAPPLAGAEWVTGPPEWLARIILQGLNGPVAVAGESWNGVMPPHGDLAALDDDTLAGLMTYLRRSWGNTADPVSVEKVAAMRAVSSNRSQPWTAAELQMVPYDRGYKRFEGEYAVSFVTFTVTEKPDGLHLSVPLYGSGLMERLSASRFSASAGGESIELEFVIAKDGTVNSLLLYRDDEKISVSRKQ